MALPQIYISKYKIYTYYYKLSEPISHIIKVIKNIWRVLQHNHVCLCCMRILKKRHKIC